MSEFDKDLEPASEEKNKPAGDLTPKWYTPGQILSGFKDCPEKQRLTILVVAAGIVGLCLGLLAPCLQVAVEQGQALAGIVNYPLHNSYYMYQVNSWNFWGQLAALGLSLGLSEAVVSFIFSGLAGIIFFEAAALWSFNFSKDIRISILAPFFLMSIHYTLKDTFGGWNFNYPIMLTGEQHTYGMLGLSLVFLIFPMIASNQYKWGFFLLGLMPGFHLSLGFWTTLSVFTAMLWNRQKLVGNLKYVFIGYALCIASFLWQRLSYPIDRLESVLESYYLDPYLTYWDGHRHSSLLFPKFGIFIVASVVFISALVLLLRQLNLSKDEKFLLRSVIIISSIAAGATLISLLPLPYANRISILLPTRFFNVISLSFIPIFLGLMWQYRKVPAIKLLLPLSILSLVLPYMRLIPRFWPGSVLIIFSLGLPLVLIKQCKFSLRVLMVFYVTYSAFVALIFWTIEILDRPLIRLLPMVIASGFIIFWKHTANIKKKQTRFSLDRASEITTLLGLVLIAGAVVLSTVILFKDRLPTVFPVQHDPILAEVSKSDGLILTASGDFPQLQLRAGRAVLIEAGALDLIPYTIEAAPEIAQIMNDIYGIDYFNPPSETWHKGSLVTLDSVQHLWQTRTPEQWEYLAQQYDFTQVLTPANWELQLPVVIRDSEATLYEIQ